MRQSLEIPNEIYEALVNAAEQDGVSPLEWIAQRLPTGNNIASYANEGYEIPVHLYGVFDSREEARPATESSEFGNAVIEKLARQGIRLP